jgi:hypothetical protein
VCQFDEVAVEATGNAGAIAALLASLEDLDPVLAAPARRLGRACRWMCRGRCWSVRMVWWICVRNAKMLAGERYNCHDAGLTAMAVAVAPGGGFARVISEEAGRLRQLRDLCLGGRRRGIEAPF